jgi:hypothetical protein
MPETAYALYVGIDWGTVTHQVAVLDAQRGLLGERAVAHEALALHGLTEWLTQLARGEPARVAVALEVPRGAVVDTLLERGFHWTSAPPTGRWWPRAGVTGGSCAAAPRTRIGRQWTPLLIGPAGRDHDGRIAQEGQRRAPPRPPALVDSRPADGPSEPGRSEAEEAKRCPPRWSRIGYSGSPTR